MAQTNAESFQAEFLRDRLSACNAEEPALDSESKEKITEVSRTKECNNYAAAVTDKYIFYGSKRNLRKICPARNVFAINVRGRAILLKSAAQQIKV